PASRARIWPGGQRVPPPPGGGGRSRSPSRHRLCWRGWGPEVSFSRWLRATSEHYLMVAAQEKVAAKYRVTPPRQPHGRGWFWLRVYVPPYPAGPWPGRSPPTPPLP